MLRLRGVFFEWKEPEQQGNLTGPQMGLMADEVEKVFPEWLSIDSEGYKQLTVRGFEALVVEALRTLKAENDYIKVQNQALETRVVGARGKVPGVRMDERRTQQWSLAMRGQLEQRLQQLKAEFETGQKMLADLEQKRANLEQTLLRISGAVQVLEELLSADKATTNGEESTSDAAKATAE